MKNHFYTEEKLERQCEWNGIENSKTVDAGNIIVGLRKCQSI